MKDSARLEPLPVTLHLPPPGRPRWVCPPSAELDLLYLGWGRRRFGDQPVPRSRHPGWVYFLVRSGRPAFRLEERRLLLRAGRVLVVGPDCASGWTDVPRGVCEVLTWVWRTPPRCDESRPPADGFIDVSAGASLRRALLQAQALCRREVERPDPLTRLALEHARLQMDLAIARARQPRVVAPASALRMELALRWMAANTAEPRPVAALCDYLQVSPVTLYRLFQLHVHESPAAYHARLRMEQARRLLADRGASVKEAAYALGYRHPNDLSRAFKKHAGVSPHTLRRPAPRA